MNKRLHNERLNELIPADTNLGLTRREKQCLIWASQGKTAFETSVILGITERTARFYIESARKKLDAVNITQAVSIALQQGLLWDSEQDRQKFMPMK